MKEDAKNRARALAPGGLQPARMARNPPKSATGSQAPGPVMKALPYEQIQWTRQPRKGAFNLAKSRYFEADQGMYMFYTLSTDDLVFHKYAPWILNKIIPNLQVFLTAG